MSIYRWHSTRARRSQKRVGIKFCRRNRHWVEQKTNQKPSIKKQINKFTNSKAKSVMCINQSGERPRQYIDAETPVDSRRGSPQDSKIHSCAHHLPRFYFENIISFQLRSILLIDCRTQSIELCLRVWIYLPLELVGTFNSMNIYIFFFKFDGQNIVVRVPFLV